MKNKALLFVLLAGVFSACEHEDLPITNELSVPVVVESSTPLRIRAVREGDAHTRTVRDESNGAVYWTPGDEISVFCGTGNNGGNKFVCNARENSAEATFSGSISGYSSYSVGDIISQESAIVAWVSEDASMAMLISGDELQKQPWGTSNNWCQNHGSGWRMPKIDELTMIHSNFAIINQALGDANYTKLTTGNNCYWSSTVNPKNTNYYYRERLKDGYVLTSTGNDEHKNSTANFTRAVKTVKLASPYYWGLYPYDSSASCTDVTVSTKVLTNQVAVPGSFATNTFPCIGRTNTTDMCFYNICGGIRFSVTKEGVTKAVLWGNNHEKLAGTVNVVLSDAGKPEVKSIEDGADSIVLEAPGGDPFEVGKYYYFVIIPTVFENGFSITFTTQEAIGTYTRSDKVTVKRSVFSGLKDVDKAVDYTVTNVETDFSVSPVDMGLGTIWSSYNLGASSLYNEGVFFAWGETRNKVLYKWGTYLWNNEGELIKYNTDGATLLEEDDPCSLYLKDTWRLPSKNDWSELISNSTFSITTLNGKSVVQAKSKKNNEVLYFPILGYRDGNTNTEVEKGYYWANGIANAGTKRADCAVISGDNSGVGALELFYGCLIRPVRDAVKDVETLEADPYQNYNYLGSTNTYASTVKGAVTVEGKWIVSNRFFYYSDTYSTLQELRVSGSTASVASSLSYPFTATLSNLKEKTQYYYVACAEVKYKNSNGSYSTPVTIYGDVKSFITPEYYLPPYVDLGLPSGVKWGTMNMGANNPLEMGKNYYYSWGSSTDYKAGDVLPLSKDRAHQTLGEYWRMPTREDWEELFQHCNCTYNSTNATPSSGIVAEGHGNKIFIPLNDYWSSTCASEEYHSSSGGYLEATAYALRATSSYFKYYVENKALNSTNAVNTTCKIRAVYVDR